MADITKMQCDNCSTNEKTVFMRKMDGWKLRYEDIIPINLTKRILKSYGTFGCSFDTCSLDVDYYACPGCGLLKMTLSSEALTAFQNMPDK